MPRIDEKHACAHFEHRARAAISMVIAANAERIAVSLPVAGDEGGGQRAA
jgi:hypothetical protein